MILASLVPAAAIRAAVVFTEDFEKFDRKNWHDFGDAPEVVQVVDGGRAGKCAQITATLGENTGTHLYRMLEPGLDTCHLRFYVKFDERHDYVHHFVHLVGYNPPTRWPQGGAGERPRGDERFSTGIEPWGARGKFPAPGAWQFYSYWCEMERSRDGKFWGNGFMPDPPVRVERATAGPASRSCSGATPRRTRPTASRRFGSTAGRSAAGAGSGGGPTSG